MRDALSPLDKGTIPSSLVAESGVQVRTLCEFVVFQPHQIFVEYLVAYQAIVANLPFSELSCCGDEEEQCGFMRMLPMCHCGQSVDKATSQRQVKPGKRYYRCGRKLGRGRGRHGDGSCDSFKWADNFSSSPGSPHKRMRQSEQL